MKAQIRIPTEPYAYLEIEFEGTEVEMVDKHNELIRLYNESKTPNGGLGQKEWNRALDGYLEANNMDAETYEAMSETQKMIIQEIKRSVKRINYKKDEN